MPGFDVQIPKRVALACANCRERKIKCITESADRACMRCHFNNMSCTYVATLKQRERAVARAKLAVDNKPKKKRAPRLALFSYPSPFTPTTTPPPRPAASYGEYAPSPAAACSFVSASPPRRLSYLPTPPPTSRTPPSDVYPVASGSCTPYRESELTHALGIALPQPQSAQAAYPSPPLAASDIASSDLLRCYGAYPTGLPSTSGFQSELALALGQQPCAPPSVQLSPLPSPPLENFGFQQPAAHAQHQNQNFASAGRSDADACRAYDSALLDGLGTCILPTPALQMPVQAQPPANVFDSNYCFYSNFNTHTGLCAC